MDRTAADRLWTAFELHDAGVLMMRAKLRRESPGVSDSEIERQLNVWLQHRPGAEFGDAEGTAVVWPRR